MGKQILYRVGQAGKDLGVSSYRIRRLCETGLIDADFSGKQWQIPAAEIERLKRDGVPSAPKIVDDSEDAEPSRTPNAKAATALLADPSPEMIAAAEEAEMSGQQLTVAKNKLEQNKVRREQVEIRSATKKSWKPMPAGATRKQPPKSVRPSFPAGSNMRFSGSHTTRRTIPNSRSTPRS